MHFWGINRKFIVSSVSNTQALDLNLFKFFSKKLDARYFKMLNTSYQTLTKVSVKN